MLYQLHIHYTLTLVANTGKCSVTGTVKRGFVSEFDCTIDVDYSDHENFEIISFTFEQTSFGDEFTVDKDSDPDLFKLLMRGVDYEWLSIYECIQEMIAADISDAQYNRPESYEDVSMGR